VAMLSPTYPVPATAMRIFFSVLTIVLMMFTKGFYVVFIIEGEDTTNLSKQQAFG
jgi:hypothetical protein